jgi:hypothetical protein
VTLSGFSLDCHQTKEQECHNMAHRDFSKISPTIWTRAEFQALSEGAKLLYLYLISNPHLDSIGCYYLPGAYAATDLGIPESDFETRLKCLTECGLVEYDRATRFLRIAGWFETNPPMNPSHAKGVLKLMERLPVESFTQKLLAEFEPYQTKIAVAEDKKTTRAVKVGENFRSAGRALDQTAFIRGRPSH